MVACTVITKRYLSYARVLQESLCEHHPGSKLYVLLADRVDGYLDPQREPFEWIFLEDLGEQDAIRKMSFYYTPFEFRCALKAFLHDYMFNHTSYGDWIYLDPDVWIQGPLDSILKQLKEASLLLSPHRTRSADSEDVYSLELPPALEANLYNGGFLGIRRSEESKRFIQWFKERLTLYSFEDTSLRRHADQTWLNFVPLYFNGVSLLIHPGANLGHWNLFERSFGRDGDGTLSADGQPILFLHFSGWDIAHPEKVSRYALVNDERTAPLWKQLSMTYRDRLLKKGYEETIRYPYAFGYFQNGRPISPGMRRIYYEEFLSGRFNGDPFFRSHYFKKRARRKQIERSIRFLGRVPKELLKILNPFRP